MTNKAYIVANEQQEHNILEKLERDGFRWQAGEKPTERIKLLVDYIEGNRTLITTEQYVVRSIDPDENDVYSYLRLGTQSTSVPNIRVAQIKLRDATHFETREEASKFLIAGMEIVEVEE